MSDNTSPKYTREQRIAKIQKLLNLAGNNSDEKEAASAAARAQELMVQWAIDEAALDAASGVQSDPFATEDVPFLKGSPQPWEAALRRAVQDATMTHGFRDTSKGVYTIAGRSTDVKMAAHMFVQLRTLLERLSRTRLSEHGAEMKTRYNRSIYNVAQCRQLSGCHPTVYRQRWLDSWLDGAQKGIKAQLEAQRQQTSVQSSTALVVVEQRREEAEAWATQQFALHTGKASKARRQFVEAQQQGIKDGLAVQIKKGSWYH